MIPGHVHGMTMLLRFMSHVCLYGARGTTPGHDCGQSVHGGSVADTAAASERTLMRASIGSSNVVLEGALLEKCSLIQ